jgi:hypothetical protein
MLTYASHSRITQRCLECVLDPQAERLRDEDGIEAEDPWDSLRRFLLHFDGRYAHVCRRLLTYAHVC